MTKAQYDVVLIGGGIMSATLGALITKLQPDWSILLVEKLDDLALESSNAWNNAGTGHSGLCELNYMPDPTDADKASEINRQFHVSRQFWASLTDSGDLADPSEFINPVPHVDVVFGERDVTYLRQRFETLRTLPLFTAMEYTENPAVIAEWAPLLMRGRTGSEPIAATRSIEATDVDFGALTRQLIDVMATAGAVIRTGTQVRKLSRNRDGAWRLRGKNHTTGTRFTVDAKFVFCGAGGYALQLLQRARIPEVKGYAVFPLGAQFFRSTTPTVVADHQVKAYSQADLGAPPMSVPHLDKRVVDGRQALLFGPYATFSTRLGKYGSLTDLFTTLRFGNLWVMITAGLFNLDLVRYLVTQLLASRKRKFQQLKHFYPEAVLEDWELVQAGQRAQLIKPGHRGRGVITFGTETVASADGSIAGLLGASPGASTSPSAMTDLLLRCFPENRGRWQRELADLMPGLDESFATTETVNRNLTKTATILRLLHERPTGTG
jgi:malate dehydrogenase (quinone)